MTSKKTGYLLGAIAGAGVMAAAVAGVGMQLPNARADQQGGVIKASTAPIFAPPPGAPLSFADIFDKVSPAVVSINVTSRVDPSLMRRFPGFENIPELAPPGEDGEDGEEGAPPQKGPSPGQPRRTQTSSGSGFFISSDGYIVTNNHVVENAETIKVVLKDERELEATIIGRDEGTDIAVLKVKGSGFPYVNFENQAKPRVGDWVIAVGNPFGLGGTATAGIVSAYGRDIGETFVDYIQIDASINRGNSGGPTFDIYGRVIGVNTAIFSPSGGSVGIGFAIPADVADATAKQLMSGGKIKRGYIGAVIQNFSLEMAEAQGLGDQRGAIISEVVKGGPSANAGLRPGDVVVAVNGRPVRTSSELTREVAKAREGDVLKLDVIREGKKRNFDLRSGVRPPEGELNNGGVNPTPGNPRTPGAPTPPAPVERPKVLGMGIAPLDGAARTRLALPDTVRGVLVDTVDATSDAAEKGIRKGDVIARAGDREINSAADLAAVVTAAKKAGRPSILIAVYRQGRLAFLPLKISG
jgi:serine protease Do